MLECGQPKTHQIQSHGGEPRGLSIISTSKKQRKFFGIHHRISAQTQSNMIVKYFLQGYSVNGTKLFLARVTRFGDSGASIIKYDCRTFSFLGLS
jgi:hypothetical protein